MSSKVVFPVLFAASLLTRNSMAQIAHFDLKMAVPKDAYMNEFPVGWKTISVQGMLAADLSADLKASHFEMPYRKGRVLQPESSSTCEVGLTGMAYKSKSSQGLRFSLTFNGADCDCQIAAAERGQVQLEYYGLNGEPGYEQLSILFHEPIEFVTNPTGPNQAPILPGVMPIVSNERFASCLH